MRSIWKGFVSFGLVNVPVKLYGATEDHSAKAHQVHSGCGGRVRQKRVCEGCSSPVEWGDIVKGYEFGEELITLGAEDLATLPSEQDRVIEVLEFVPAGSLDPLQYETSYFLGPEKGADKPYALLTTTLMNVDRIALVKFAMRGATRLAALRVLPKEGVLVMHTLKWPDEIRHPDFVVKDVEITPKEADLADELVKALWNEFNADRYRDVYQEELQALIAAKASGGELPKVEKTEPEDVSDLLAKLEASIKSKKGKKK